MMAKQRRRLKTLASEHPDVSRRGQREEHPGVAGLPWAVADRFPGLIYRSIRHPDGRLSYPHYTGRLVDVLGIRPWACEEMTSLSTLVLQEDRQLLADAIERSARDLSPLTIDVRVIAPSGKICWLRSESTPRRLDNGGVLWEAVAIDVTEQREAASRTNALERQVAELQKVAALGKLTGEIAHDVNNILQVVLTNAEVLALVSESTVHRQLSEVFRRAAERGTSLVRLFLACARR
jgi:signal transduction histidine kinase